MTKKKDTNKYPREWNRDRTDSVIDFYDRQTEVQAIAEADAAFENSRMTLVRVPNELVAEVERLLEQHRGKRVGMQTSGRKRKSA